MSVAFLLVRWQGENARQVTIFVRFFVLRGKRNVVESNVFSSSSSSFYFGKISDDMKTLSVEFGQHVEHERIGVVIQRFVIEKQFRQETNVVRVAFVLSSVDFEEGDFVVSINFVAGRMDQRAFRLDDERISERWISSMLRLRDDASTLRRLYNISNRIRRCKRRATW